MSTGFIRTKTLIPSPFDLGSSSNSVTTLASEGYLSREGVLQFWASAMVVFPVLLQAPWVHMYPLTASIFSLVIFAVGVGIVKFGGDKFLNLGSLVVGVSASWLGGCLFWGWLRAHPMFHLPVESILLPIAVIALASRWKIGASFYLSCLLGTAFTDLAMVFTGVMNDWPAIVLSPVSEAGILLHGTAQKLLEPVSIFIILIVAILILIISYFMRNKARNNTLNRDAWLVANAALTTTLLIDGLFFLTAILQPTLSGLI